MPHTLRAYNRLTTWLRRRRPRPAFTLLELTLVLAILAALATITVPYAAVRIRNQAAEKAARESLAVADAARSYFVANTAWPASIAVLQTGGFLPASWSGTNPFGNAYTMTSATTLTVSSVVPSDVAALVARLLPLGTQTAVTGGTQVSGVWPRPGQASDLSAVLHTDGSNWMTGNLQVKNTAGTLIHSLNPDGTVNLNQNAVTVLPGGNVGIGTANPDAKLHAFSGTTAFVKILQSALSRALYVKGAGITNGSFQLYTENQVGTIGLTVTDGGLVGLGTTTPNEELEVAGRAQFVGTSNSVASQLGKGLIFFDSLSNRFKISENGASPITLVGGPSSWTCVIRNSPTVGGNTATGIQCVAPEKVISGGYTTTGAGCAGQASVNHPDPPNGWVVIGVSGDINCTLPSTVIAWALC